MATPPTKSNNTLLICALILAVVAFVLVVKPANSSDCPALHPSSRVSVLKTTQDCPVCPQAEPCPACNCPNPNCPATGSRAAESEVSQQESSAPVDLTFIPEGYRTDCAKFMVDGSTNSIYSQFRQDWFIYQNYFKDRKYVGKGFYVDVGANHAKTLSNTLFFDKCLGWKGICVEPNPQYAKGYEERSCKLIRNCVYNQRKSLWFDMPRGVNKGTAGRILNCTDDGVCSDKGIGDKVKIECLTLDSILQDAGLDTGSAVIDLLSLDVEGNEIDVLEGFPFSHYNMSIVTVEMNKIPQNKLHYIMSQGGFYKDISVGIDDVFVRRPRQYHFPPDWKSIGPYSMRYHP